MQKDVDSRWRFFTGLHKLGIAIANNHNNNFMNVLHVDSETKANIELLCETGHDEYQHNHYAKALRLFYQAWLQLPKPQSQYHHAPWILTAIGDCYFKQGSFKQAIEALNSALHCPSIKEEEQQLGFMHIRLGQSFYQQGNQPLARQHFNQAQRLAPKQIKNISSEYRHFINSQEK